jgi:hypothetical protein
MTSIRKAFRIAAIFLVAFALLPLIIVHSRFASEALTPRNELDHYPKDRLVPVTAPTNLSVKNEKSTKAQKQDDRWINGCQALPAGTEQRETPPTGLVVVLALAPINRNEVQDTRQRICHAIPAQIEYFLGPQSLDMLFLVEEKESIGWTVQQFANCWELEPAEPNAQRTWHNLDGSILTATPYHYNSPGTHLTTIFLARTNLEYPNYIQKDMSILSHAITPRACEAPRNYIQATRWYTQGLLHLGILKDYDYFLKIDTDILFLKSIPFHILQDMANKNAVFGHTTEYHPKGSKTCTTGIHKAMLNFTETIAAYHPREHHLDLPSWKRSLCTNSAEVQNDIDLYYTNFIVGKVSLW